MAFGKLVRTFSSTTGETTALPSVATFDALPDYEQAMAVELHLNGYSSATENTIHVFKLEDGQVTKVTPDEGWVIAQTEDVPAPYAIYVWANSPFKLYAKVTGGTVSGELRARTIST
jgi:hypothetical protein